ncbi:hypothetical protein [Sphaerisporangium perillae]|uniref:hypothetical protein n=1 Tax=Sphaerisporangium perillae TaxID=2935860 RepID=UPI00200FC532|nr:hypothetical protein [Sphaerisporangium perillae]
MAAVDTQALRSAGYRLPAQPDTTPPTAPTNLRLSERGHWWITLAWDPSKDGPDYPVHPGVVAYDIYRSGSPFRLIASVPANVLTYTDRVSICETVSYYVRARDAAGNVSPPSNVVNRPGREKCDHKDEHDKQDKHEKQDETDVVTTEPESLNKVDKFDRYDKSDNHHSDDDDEIIKADRFLHLENANDHGGGHHNSDRDHHYGGHDFGGHEGGPGGEESGAEASGGHKGGGHAGGGHEAGGQQAARSLPFTGAPVAAVAGVGSALLVAGAAGVLISVRRRRTTGAR